MRKILIVGDFSSDTSDVNSFLEQHFHTQLCTDSGKIVKSMLKMYAPELVLMDIDGFENLQEEVFEAIKEYNPDLPVITYGREKKKQDRDKVHYRHCYSIVFHSLISSYSGDISEEAGL